MISTQAKAQQPSLNYIPTTFPKSPNAAAFDKYGDYPVNLFSGLPDISIPLYTIEAGGLKVPITLSYHASGIKVQEAATWVGLGWSLSNGGNISRQIMGAADETGYFGYQGLPSLDPHHQAGLDSLHAMIILHGGDTRPDIYSYNLPGISGKFFFNAKNGFKPTTIPYSPIAISKIPGTPFAFDVTDDHGNIYTLGKNTTETTSTSYTSGNGNSSAVTNWLLEKMISQNRRDTINFSYSPKSVTLPDQNGQSTIVEDSETDYSGGSSCTGTYVNGNPVTVIADVSSSMNEQDIQHITFKNGKVDFILDASQRSDLPGGNPYGLNTINVYSYNFSLKNYELQKSIKFYKTYFAGLAGAQARLRLDSIQILDKAGSIIQHYRFKYNNQQLPGYGSYSKDFWGYYNGKMDNPNITNKTLIPRTEIGRITGAFVDSLYIGADTYNTRLPDSTYMQANVLDTIYYPTGGHTILTYQTNRYIDSHGVTQLTGGLRVSSISSFDGISATPIVKTYQYNAASPNFITSSSSNGQLAYGFFTNSEIFRLWTSLANLPNPGGIVICRTKRVRTFTSDPGYSLTPSDGNPVAYTTVTEYIGTPGNNIGKSVYTYSYGNYLDQFQSASSTQIPIIYDYAFMRGQLLDKSDYLNKPDGTYQIVKDVSNTYSAFPETRYDAVGVVVGEANYNEGACTVAYYGSFSPDDLYTYPAANYGIVSDDNYLTGTSTTIYDTSDPTKSTNSSVSYGYDDITHQQVATVVHIDSKGNTHTSYNRYAHSYPLTGGSTGSVILDSLMNRHMFSEVVEKWENIYYPSTSTTATLNGQLNLFQFGNIPYSIVPFTVSILNISSPMSGFTPSTVISGSIAGNSNYKQMISFDKYDPQNNIAQYTPRNSPPVSILWDYQYALPVAQIKDATYNYTAGTQAAYTSFEAPRNGGWNYTGIPVIDITAPTGSYVYPLSAGSVTSNNFDNTQPYLISLWSNNGAPTIYAGSYLTGTPLRIANGWTYYEYTVPTAASVITISGSMSIDELRFYPANSQMTSYTYDPSGLRAITDTKGQISYFEYDPFQRLKNVKDWNGNIVKNFGYHTYDMTVPNDTIAATVFTRNNCPSGTAPQSTTYSVASGKYVSSTKASANAEAQYDLATNGQVKANNPAICGCPVITTANFTLTNSSGYTGWQAVFTGGSNPTYNFPSSGSTVVQIPLGTYTSVYIGPIGSATHTFTLGSRNPITGAHSATFTSVVIATSGSTDTSLTVN